jgi:hypothetical protein
MQIMSTLQLCSSRLVVTCDAECCSPVTKYSLCPVEARISNDKRPAQQTLMVQKPTICDKVRAKSKLYFDDFSDRNFFYSIIIVQWASRNQAIPT